VVDRRADLFACGIVLWEALATKRLFKGDGEAETLNRVLYDPILPPSSARPDVPKALEDICMKALSRDIDQRFATAQDFGDALEKAARALDSVGSVRDVAECLQEVIGVDLTQQRDAVRAWLARSEPSHTTGPRSRPAVLDSIVTRVEGGSKSEPSNASSASSSRRGGMPGSGARTGPTEPAPLSLRGDSSAPDKVSSVSSAVIQVPHSGYPNETSTPNVPAASRSRTGGRIAMAVVAALVLVGVGALGARSLGGGTTKTEPTSKAAATAAAAATTPDPATSTGAGTPAAPVAPAETAAVASAAPSAAPSAHAIGAAAKPIGRPGPAVVRPAGSGKPVVPSGNDDLMNKNPYR
jgi:serine/threonine-protein kinase